MINKVLLIGNLGKDPEVKHFEGGGMVAKFSVATNENYMDKAGEWQKKTEWHDVVVWNKNAERAEKNLKKGMMVYIEGKLTHRKWQDDQGNNRYTTEVVANTYRMLERRERTDAISGGSFPEPNAINQSNTTTNNNPPSAPAMDDDLPF